MSAQKALHFKPVYFPACVIFKRGSKMLFLVQCLPMLLCTQKQRKYYVNNIQFQVTVSFDRLLLFFKHYSEQT